MWEEPFVLVIERGLIILLGLTIFYSSLRYYRTIRNPWRWIKLAYAGVGLYWAVIYVFTFFEPWLLQVHDPFGPLFVRPGVVLTLSIMAAGNIMSYKRLRVSEQINQFLEERRDADSNRPQ